MLSVAWLYLALVVSSADSIVQGRYSCSFSPTLSPDMSTDLLAQVFPQLRAMSLHPTWRCRPPLLLLSTLFLQGLSLLTCAAKWYHTWSISDCMLASIGRRLPETRPGLFSAYGAERPLSVFAPETFDFLPEEGFAATAFVRMPINASVASAKIGFAIKCLGVYTQLPCGVSTISTPFIGNIRTAVNKIHYLPSFPLTLLQSLSLRNN